MPTVCTNFKVLGAKLLGFYSGLTNNQKLNWSQSSLCRLHWVELCILGKACRASISIYVVQLNNAHILEVYC